MTGAWEWWSAEAIALACACPLANVQEHWPRIWEQLGRCSIQTPNVAIGVLGTTAIEGASTFQPVKEGCYLGEPEPAETHRQTLDYFPYFGRGHVQLTHEGNYRRYGQKIETLWEAPPGSIDLVSHPDGALDPNAAAAVISLWFRDTRALPSVSYPAGYTLLQACEERDWGWVRRLVYGGPDPEGAARIAGIERDLGPPGGIPVSPPVLTLPIYDWQYPAISQNDNWSCSCTSMRWALFAYERAPTEQWLEGSMLSEGVVSMNDGLLLATGQRLAEWATAHYGEFGYHGEWDPQVGFDDVAAEARTQKHPLLIGGRTWGHWSGVRGGEHGTLQLANPAFGWKGVGQVMTREQFEHLGSFSLVRLVHDQAEAGAVTPPVDPGDPYAAWRGQVGSGLLDMMAVDATLPASRCSTWLPLGVPSPHDVEQCPGQNGVTYSWQLTTGQGFRYHPA